MPAATASRTCPHRLRSRLRDGTGCAGDGIGSMKIVYSDVLVIGGGLAGLRVAIAVRRRKLDAIVLSLVPAKRSHSAAAQGGMQASLGNVVKGAGDNEDVHFEDTVRGSDWGADQRIVADVRGNGAEGRARTCRLGGPVEPRAARRPRDHHQRRADDHHRTRCRARPDRAARLRRNAQVADLLCIGRYRARDALRGRRSGDRSGDAGARAQRGARADPRRLALLRRCRPRSRDRRAHRLRRPGDRDRDRRRGPPVPGDDQCA